MEPRPSDRPRPWAGRPFAVALAVATTLLLAPGCRRAESPADTTGTMTDATPTIPPDVAPGPKMDVRLVAVSPPGGAEDRNFDPPSIKVKKKRQIVVWVLDGEGTLKIEFAADKNPFDSQPSCEGRFCVALRPPSADKPAGFYPYTAVVTTAEGTQSADPDVEVID